MMDDLFAAVGIYLSFFVLLMTVIFVGGIVLRWLGIVDIFSP